jgi:hypothetical protein
VKVRAASLSGDCNWKYEFFRKNFNVSKQHQVCVVILYLRLRGLKQILYDDTIDVYTEKGQVVTKI